MLQSRDTKQSITIEIVSGHAQCFALVYKHYYLSKALMHLLRIIENGAIAHLTPYLESFFHCAINLVQREL